MLGANQSANFEGIKSIAELNRRIESGESIMRNGSLTDAGFIALETQIKELKALIESAATKQIEPVIIPLNWSNIITALKNN